MTTIDVTTPREISLDGIPSQTWRDRTPDMQPDCFLREFVEPPPSEKVQAALALVEQAQHLILEAAQCLCPVQGYCDEWDAAGKLYDRVKAYWHELEARRVTIGPSHCKCIHCGTRLPDHTNDCPSCNR